VHRGLGGLGLVRYLDELNRMGKGGKMIVSKLD
jgi:hypothetical protein